MEDLISEDKKFKYSGEESKLEYYKCFHDPSAKSLITGEELIELEKRDSWSDTDSRIWYFFYRPYNFNIGSKQKLFIDEIGNNISSLNNSIRRINFYMLTLILSCAAIIYFSIGIQLIALPISVLIFLFVKKTSIYTLLESNNRNIRILYLEIDYLLKQQKFILLNQLSPNKIEKIFWLRLKGLEQVYIDKATHESYESINKNNPNFYKSLKKEFKSIPEENFPAYPVIPSWALLQSPYKHTKNSGIQKTGLIIAGEKIGNKIATWRNSGNNKLLFRLWYIQSLFFHDKNLSIMSFYYDFITHEVYSEHIESYQYNHITNYSYTDEDISDMNNDSFIKNLHLPEKLTKNIFGNEVKTLTLESASGAYHKTVIPDIDVSKGLNAWMKYKNESEIKEDIISRLSEIDSDFLADEKRELFKIKEDYDGIIETLAWLSFKLLREKVASFALTENN